MKLIDADKLKESIRRNDGYGSWNESDVLCAIDREPEVLLSCPKCHGKGKYAEVVIYDRFGHDEDFITRICEVCHGEKTLTIEAYEGYQERCRGKK